MTRRRPRRPQIRNRVLPLQTKTGRDLRARKRADSWKPKIYKSLPGFDIWEMKRNKGDSEREVGEEMKREAGRRQKLSWIWMLWYLSLVLTVF